MAQEYINKAKFAEYATMKSLLVSLAKEATRLMGLCPIVNHVGQFT
jgi:hypothetical protein